MNKELWIAVQQKLAAAGLYRREIDGIPGIGTRTALKAWQRSKGQQVLAEPDARQLRMLGIEPPKQSALIVPPWGIILDAKMGLHEQRDKAALQAFLKSDGSTLGDPSKLPWCGDLVETVMLNSGYGPVPGNPYLARNWRTYGVASTPGYYVLTAFWRGSPDGTDGHVGFVVGISEDGSRLRVRGGNQQNQIGDVWIAAKRVLSGGHRKPEKYKGPFSPLPILNDNAEPLSVNEA